MFKVVVIKTSRQHKHIGPTSARCRAMSATTSGRCRSRRRPDVGRCRQRRRPDIGKRAADVHPTLPISARPHACTEARRRQRRLNVGSRYRPDRMLAQRLDVGNVGSMSEADIGPTACLHRGSTSATSAQCRKPISGRRVFPILHLYLIID